MKTHVYVKMLVMMLLLCSCLFGQTTRPTRPPRGASAETSRLWYGVIGTSIGAMPRAYNAPIVTGYGGVEYNGRKVFSRTIARVGYARKIDTNDGYDAGFETGVYVGGANFLFGGGVNYAYQKTSLYSKDSLHPTVGIAMRWNTSREITVKPVGVATYDTQVLFISRMLLPGRDSSNALLGPKFTLLVPVTTRWRVGSDFGFYSFRPSGQPHAPRTWTAAFAGNVEFRF